MSYRPTTVAVREETGPHGGDAPGGIARGFTFVEILIALAIAGILAAIAVPNYLNYLQTSREDTAASDIKTIAWRLTSILLENSTLLPDSLAQLPAANTLPLTDPWGNPYQYLPITGHPGNLNQTRKDHSLHPINTDFDLYSMGPDGQSNKPLTSGPSRDDIIRANDGAFIGRASAYDP